MSMQFWPCPGCSRHVKRGDASCPFCGATASVNIGPTRTIAGRLSRAALFATGAVSAAVVTTDCSATSTPFYGAAVIPFEDSGASDGVGGEAADAGDASTVSEPTDSSSTSEDATSVTDGSSNANDASAATVPTDASTVLPDGPSAVPLYGGFAPPYGLAPLDE